MSKVKIGIIGYGNLGKGVEMAIQQNPDMELIAIFTRREPQLLETHSPVVSIKDVLQYKDKIDVMLLCGGSATDLFDQGPVIAANFNTVDSFDTHARISEYFDRIDEVAQRANRTSLISTGWDPGLFSLNRLLGQSVLPKGEDYTFWGKGVSQGHSDAIRRLPGVAMAIQYTVPKDSALQTIRNGEPLTGTSTLWHDRLCYVVTKEGADQDQIKQAIVTMPNYFADYNTSVEFISKEEFTRSHAGMPHGGSVFRTGITGENTKQLIEFRLELESNPEFTASVLVAYARAVYRFSQEGKTGALTVFDVPLAYLSPKSARELRQEIL